MGNDGKNAAFFAVHFGVQSGMNKTRRKVFMINCELYFRVSLYRL